MKKLYQKKTDELSWKNTDALRGIVRRRAELAETLVLESAEDVRRLADALAAGGAPGGDVVGGARETLVAGVPLRKGTRVEVPPTTPLGDPANTTGAARQRKRGRAGQAAGPTTEELVRRIRPGPQGVMEERRGPRGGADAEAVAIGNLADLIWDPRPIAAAAKE